MNAAQSHLLLNHAPIFGAFFGVVIWFFGIIRRNPALLQTAYYTIIIAAVLTLPTSWSGEGAEDIVEKWGVSHDIIHEHEEAAELAALMMYVLGVVALVALIFRDAYWASWLNWGGFLFGVFVFILMAQAGHSGGAIRHPEIKEGAVPPTTTPSKSNKRAHQDHDDD